MKTERTRKLVTIMFTDIVGYSRMMSANEDRALWLLDKHDSALSHSIEKFGGKILKRMGDAVFAEFGSATSAVQCGIDIQQALRAHNDENTPEDQLCIRIGIHLGDVVVRDNDLFGEGINIAARLEPLAHPGGICISQAVFQAIKMSSDIEPILVGEVELKNILERHVIYQFPPFYEVSTKNELPKETRGSAGKGSHVKLARTEKLPPTNSGLPILVLYFVFIILGGLTGWLIAPASPSKPFELHVSEIHDARHIVVSLSQTKSNEMQNLWHRVSVKGKDELLGLQRTDQSEANDRRIKDILIQEFNDIIGGTSPLVQSAGSSDKVTTAAKNRQTFESLFPDELSVLLKPRGIAERTIKRFNDDPTSLWFIYLAILAVVGCGIGAFVTQRPATTRYVFDDIRDVDEMFEYLVGELGFKPPIRQGKSLVFRAKLSTFLMWGVTKFSVRIDGNSVVVSGQALFVKKLTKLLIALAGKTT